MQMPVEKFADFIILAMEQERKEQVRNQWTAMLPYMSIGYLKYMSFDDYYNKCTGSNIDLRPTEEIIAEIEEAHRNAHKKKEGE